MYDSYSMLSLVIRTVRAGQYVCVCVCVCVIHCVWFCLTNTHTHTHTHSMHSWFELLEYGGTFTSKRPQQWEYGSRPVEYELTLNTTYNQSTFKSESKIKYPHCVSSIQSIAMNCLRNSALFPPGLTSYISTDLDTVNKSKASIDQGKDSVYINISNTYRPSSCAYICKGNMRWRCKENIPHNNDKVSTASKLSH